MSEQRVTIDEPVVLNTPVAGPSSVAPVPRRNRSGSTPQRQRSLTTGSQAPNFTSGSALGKTSSRLSTHTYVDAAMVAPAINELMREDTRVSMREKRERDRTRDINERIGEAEEKEEEDKDKKASAGHELGGSESRSSSEIVEEIPYPDGGLRAWLVLAGAFAGAVCAYGMVASWGAWQSYYASHLLKQYPNGTIAWIGSTQALICFGLGFIGGPLFDRYGHRVLAILGTLLTTLGFICLSFSTKYYQILLSQGVLVALGINLLFMVPVGVTGQWFKVRRGLAFGIIMSGSSIGAIMWPLLVANAIPSIGFPWTMRLIALLIALLGALGTCLMRTRLPPRPAGKFFYFQAFQIAPYSLYAFAAVGFVMNFFFFLTFIGTYTAAQGLVTIAPYMLITTNGASGIGRLASGFLADRYGKFNVAIAGTIVMIICTFSWLACKTAASLIVLCIIYGMCSGAYIAIQANCLVSFAPDSNVAGSMIGQALTIQGIFQFIGPPALGALLGSGTREQQLRNFPKGIAVAGVLLCLCTAMLLTARLLLSRKVFVAV